MEPTLLPALHSIYEAIAVDGQKLILFENNTYLLIRADDTIDSLINQIGSFDPTKMVDLTLHFYTTHDILLFMQPDYPTIGIFKIIKKGAKLNMNTEKVRAIKNMRKDMGGQKIIVDGRVDNLTELSPVMCFVVNTSLKMGKGKICAQVGHAVETLIEGLLKKPTQDYVNWKYSLRRKIVLKATQEEIDDFIKNAAEEKDKNNRLIINNDTFVTVRDAGLTQVDPGSLTVLGFIPMEGRSRPDFLKNLKLL